MKSPIPNPSYYSEMSESVHQQAAPERIAKSSVARNSLLLFGFQVLTKILGFVSSILLANYLGTQLFGSYNYTLALTALFIPLCDLGMDMLLMREVPRLGSEEGMRLYKSVILGKSLLTILVYLLLTITAGSLETFSSDHFVLILLAGSVTLLRTYWTTFGSILRAWNRVKDEATYYSLARLAEFLVILGIVFLKRGIIALFVSLALVNVVAVAVTYLYVESRLPATGLRTDWTMLRQTIRVALPFALTTVFVSIYFNFDTVLVSKIIGEDAAGLYRAAYNLILPLLMVTASVSGALFPFISQNYRDQPEEAQGAVRQSVFYLLAASIPVAVITTLTSSDIVGFLFNNHYAEASLSLSILVWFLPIVYITNLFGNTLGAMDMQPYVLKVAMINVVVNIGANIVLIPRFAQNGAAVVTVLTELVGLVFLTMKMRSFVHPLVGATQIGTILLSCGICVAFLLAAPHFYVLLRLLCALICYVIGMFILRAFTRRDLVRLWALMKGTP